MKKLIGIALVLAMMAMVLSAGIVSAGDPIDVDVNWDGSGGVGGTVIAGTTVATTSWQSVGSGISGTFTANYNVGGGSYGGNSYGTSMDASATDGIIEFSTLRGAFGYTNGGALEGGGQQSYSFVGTGYYTYPEGENPVWHTTTGTASMKTRTYTEAPCKPFTGTFSGLGDHTYGWTGSNFDAASAYTIIRQMTASDNDFVQAIAVGSGTADLDCGHAYASGDAATLAYRSGYNFGWNQDFTATDTGTFSVIGQGNNSVKFYDYWGGLNDLGDQTGVTLTQMPGPFSKLVTGGNSLTIVGTGSPASASWGIIASFTSGIAVDNYSVTAQ